MKAQIVLLAYLSCAASLDLASWLTSLPSKPKAVQQPGFRCNHVGLFVDPTSCSNYYRCKRTLFGVFKVGYFTCPFNMFFSTMYQRCVMASQSDCLAISTTIVPTRPSTTVLPAFICVQQGRFIDPQDPTCKLYYNCVMGANGQFSVGLYSCPGSTFFSNLYQRCVEAGQSDCLLTSTPITSTTTPVPPLFTCVQNGMFADPYDTSCKIYFNCVMTANGVFNVARFACPGSTFFSNLYQRCVEAIQSDCLATTSTIPPISSTTAQSIAPTPGFPDILSLSRRTNEILDMKLETRIVPAQFVCDKQGKFRDPHDSSCKLYYDCVIAANGVFNAARISCPYSTLFSDAHKRCIHASESDCLGARNSSLPRPFAIDISSTPHFADEISIIQFQDQLNSVSPDFLCDRQGRFKDQDDLTCKFYFLCVIGDNGEFNLAHYNCPGTTFFSGRYGRCVEASLSECEPITTTTESELPEMTSSSDAPTTLHTDFECTTEGRFKDEHDLTCQLYYLCVLSENGVMQNGHYSCPGATHFDHNYRRCMEASKSACVPITINTENPIINMPTTSDSTDSSTTSTQTGRTTTDIQTSEPTTITDEYTISAIKFECTEDGRFKDKLDFTCKKYYLCVLDEDGVMQKGHYDCPGKTFFNNYYRRCMEASKSECIPVTTSTEDLTTITQTTCESTYEPTTSSHTDDPTINSSTNSSNASLPTEAQTTSSHSDDLVTNSTNETLTSSSSTDGPFTSSPTDIPTTSVSEYECSQEGRFKDEQDLTCKKYYLCVIGDNGKFNLGHYSCPGTTLFSITYRRCVEASLSQCEPITTTTADSQPTSTPEAPITGPPEFICSSEGRFKDEQDLICKWYYLCVIGADGSMQKGYYPCPGDTLFNNNDRRCVHASKSECVPTTTTTTYVPNTSSTGDQSPTSSPTDIPPTISLADSSTASPHIDALTTVSTTDTPSSITPTDAPTTNSQTDSPTTNTPVFSCTEGGRFKDELDLTCKKYYLCVIGDKGRFNLGHYSCPGTTLFSSRYRKCVQASTSECEPLTTSTESASKPPEPQSSSTTDTPNTAPPQFVCTSEGRFKDEKDLTCKWYYLCVIGEDGTMQKGHYSCPGDSLFNSNYRRCMEASK